MTSQEMTDHQTQSHRTRKGGKCGGVTPQKTPDRSSPYGGGSDSSKGGKAKSKPMPPQTEAQVAQAKKREHFAGVWRPRQGDTSDRAHVLSVPWPYRLTEMPQGWKTKIIDMGKEEGLEVSFRSHRAAARRDDPMMSSNSMLLHIRGKPHETDARARSIEFFQLVCEDVQSSGLAAPSLTDESYYWQNADHDDETDDGASLATFTYQGTTVEINRSGITKVEAVTKNRIDIRHIKNRVIRPRVKKQQQKDVLMLKGKDQDTVSHSAAACPREVPKADEDIVTIDSNVEDESSQPSELGQASRAMERSLELFQRRKSLKEMESCPLFKVPDDDVDEVPEVKARETATKASSSTAVHADPDSSSLVLQALDEEDVLSRQIWDRAQEVIAEQSQYIMCCDDFTRYMWGGWGGGRMSF